MSQTKAIAILNTSAPFSSSNAKDSLDVSLIMGTYEQQVSLYFVGDGVWQLIDNQSPDMLHIKNFLKTFAAFEFYDIDNIFVCEKSLKERGLPLKFHIDDVKLLNEQSLSVCLQHHDIILRF